MNKYLEKIAAKLTPKFKELVKKDIRNFPSAISGHKKEELKRDIPMWRKYSKDVYKKVNGKRTEKDRAAGVTARLMTKILEKKVKGS